MERFDATGVHNSCRKAFEKIRKKKRKKNAIKHRIIQIVIIQFGAKRCARFQRYYNANFISYKMSATGRVFNKPEVISRTV